MSYRVERRKNGWWAIADTEPELVNQGWPRVIEEGPVLNVERALVLLRSMRSVRRQLYKSLWKS